MVNTHKRLKGRCPTINAFYSITLCCDHRKPLFSNYVNARLITKELFLFSKSNSINTICYVVMPDHVHWFFQLSGTANLSGVVRKFKNITTHNLNKQNSTSGKIWQSNYYDHQVRDERDLIAQARYIVANPLRAKLVDNISKYPYWDCVYL
ncbi:transposase [Pseudoalteromonas sp. CR1]|jgi:putative transposase|uniref:REP-associated tyrosine transposase n=1 Tax=Pseudoalteromonas sp. CR1 TaxID=2861964 RepID=UPI001C5FF84F|nr:transposase [Pseudoalteromonas sp. CR1]MBW4967877.1 transposase [Pseudoalteromonas sp. CR1]